MSEQERYNNLGREVDVIVKVCQFLQSGKFSGAAAMDLVTCQMYMNGLYKHMKSEYERLAPLPMPEAVKTNPDSDPSKDTASV